MEATTTIYVVIITINLTFTHEGAMISNIMPVKYLPNITHDKMAERLTTGQSPIRPHASTYTAQRSDGMAVKQTNL